MRNISPDSAAAVKHGKQVLGKILWSSGNLDLEK